MNFGIHNMKKLTLLLALASVVTVASAADPVVLKDTRQYAATGGGQATIGGEYLVRQGDICVKTTYRPLNTSLNVAPSIGTTKDDFRCDAMGNPL